MGIASFDAPTSVHESISLLNASYLWNLSIVQRSEGLCLYDGDQLMFVADMEQEVKAFLLGAFLATFNGKPLRQITDLIQSGWFETRNIEEISDEIDEERLRKHAT